MAAEAEAAREARAKVIAAEGEHKASKALKHAAEVIIDSPAALQVDNSTHCILWTAVLTAGIAILGREVLRGARLDSEEHSLILTSHKIRKIPTSRINVSF